MKITIGYLYYDLLNLYGDSGNIKTLKYHLEEQGVKVDIKNISLNDEKKFDDLDLIYVGSGTNDNLMVALEDLKKDKKKLEKYIKDNKMILATGNSVELFGNYIVTKKKIKTLGLFDYVCMRQKRIVKDVKTDTNLVDEKIIGFENHDGKILNFDEDIVNIDKFYGTYIIGPILVRNPKLCSFFVKELITNKEEDFKFKDENYDLDIKAYNKTVETN